jgi:hypothetical protein
MPFSYLFIFGACCIAFDMFCEYSPRLWYGMRKANYSDCTNSTTGAHFASYEIFPVCTDNSTPQGICDSVIFTATGCPYTIAPGAVCQVHASFMPEKTGTYQLDFNDKYGSVTYYDIFCDDPQKGCITADATPFAYVTASVNGSIIDKCPLNTTGNNAGEFLSCSTAYDGSNQSQSYTQLTFAVVAGVQYAYVTNEGGFVYQCTLNPNGDFDDCAATPQTSPGWGQPYAITFATVNGVQYAYVSDVDSGQIYQCFLDPTEGFFTSCSTNTNISSPAPYGIDFATVGGVQYAYIADAGLGGEGNYGQVYRCTVNAQGGSDNGSLQACIATLAIPHIPNWIPYGIDFATINGAQYAYIADNGTSTSNGHVYQCHLNMDNTQPDENGTFTSCTAQSNPTNGWNPSDIAFATLNGTQYAYVTSYISSTSGNAYWCTLDNAFNCTATPSSSPSPWAPTSIAFRFN